MESREDAAAGRTVGDMIELNSDAAPVDANVAAVSEGGSVGLNPEAAPVDADVVADNGGEEASGSRGAGLGPTIRPRPAGNEQNLTPSLTPVKSQPGMVDLP